MNWGRLFGALLIMLVVFFGMKWLQSGEGLDVRQAYTMARQGALLLDVREADEYAAGHAPDAKLIPLGKLGSRLPELAVWKDKPIVVICHSGRRSAKAVAVLKQAGYTRVANVKGGMLEWEKAGLEVVRAKQTISRPVPG